ncbi:MAG: phosphonopyruvate decarboxylase [Proteobacteria bacterium]|nr:phosphonopyruvate decarboxylase [Pseudomonadota bacterium]
MIAAGAFLDRALAAGFDFYTGVPCSFLTPLIDGAINHERLAYVGAASEGEAVAIASGAWLAGRRTVVMCQNSGLGNAVNPLTSLNDPFRIPTLLIVTWRGSPGIGDEPQHDLMGRITANVLDLLEVPHRPFPAAEADVAAALDHAVAGMDGTGRSFALIMEKGDVEGGGDMVTANPVAPERGKGEDYRENGPPPARIDALETVLSAVSEECAIIATTGKCGRELFTLADRPQHLYQVGSMGCAGGMGLGVALNVDKPVVVLDGDGAALMKMGTFATIGAHGPANLIHIVLDNGTHDSTGGQPTVSASVDFAAVALACGYARAHRCDGLDGFRKALASASADSGPHLIHMRIAPGSVKNLGRPTIKPAEVALRFRDFLASAAVTDRKAGVGP